MKRRWFLISFLLAVLVAALAVHIDWTWKRQLSPRGGRYFFHRVELAVPSFRQSDEKWRDDPLGGIEANGTLGGEGEAYFGVEEATSFWKPATAGKLRRDLCAVDQTLDPAGAIHLISSKRECEILNANTIPMERSDNAETTPSPPAPADGA